jgi:hypothetical protein
VICTETLKAHVSPEIKLQAKAVAEREFLSEAAWMKRLVLREIRACDATRVSEGESSPVKGDRRQGRYIREAPSSDTPSRFIGQHAAKLCETCSDFIVKVRW